MAIKISEYKVKKRITAGLLGIFLGLFGVHNFYLGYKIKSIVQLCLSLSGPALFYLAICLADVAYSTSKTGLAGFVQFIFFMSIFIAILACAWWLVDIVRIFIKKINDSYGQSLQ